MAYRSDLEALKTRYETLERELSDTRARAQELAGLNAREGDLARQLEEVKRQLEGVQGRRSLPMALDDVRVASPCTADWSQMAGDDRVRFCGQCEKNVYNLSAMTRGEAEDLLRAKEGDVCARLYRRADGTVITADCPVGAKKKRVKRVVTSAVAGTMLATIAGAVGLRLATREPEHVMGTVAAFEGEPETPAVMGSIAAPPPTDPPPQVHPEPKRHPSQRGR